MQGDVYSYSNWITLKAADLYYMQDKSQKEICHILGISSTTTSRLLQRARNEGFISFSIPDSYRECLAYAEMLITRYGLKDAIVVYNALDAGGDGGDESTKRMVAQEGARYVQRIIRPEDELGVAWGGTMQYLIHYLNPCRKTDNSFLTLHGRLDCCDYEMDVNTLVRRMTMALGGRRYMLTQEGLQPSPDKLESRMSDPAISAIFDMFERITISISGVGSFYPEPTSPLSKLEYLQPLELAMLREKGVYGDLMLRFFDKNGAEIESSLKDRTLAISFDIYRRIPNKIIAANGAHKAHTIKALLKGRLADVLIIDLSLAKAVLTP